MTFAALQKLVAKGESEWCSSPCGVPTRFTWNNECHKVGYGRYGGWYTPDADADGLYVRGMVDRRKRWDADHRCDNRGRQYDVLRALDAERRRG